MTARTDGSSGRSTTTLRAGDHRRQSARLRIAGPHPTGDAVLLRGRPPRGADPDHELAAEELSRLGVMRRVALLLFSVGGVVCCSGVLITQRTEASKRGQAVCVAVLIACGLVVLLLPARRSTIRATLFVGIVDIGLLVGVSAPLGMAPLCFLWPLLFCAYFFPKRTLVAAFAVMFVCSHSLSWSNETPSSRQTRSSARPPAPA